MPIGGGGLDTYSDTFTGIDANSEGAVTGSITLGLFGRVGLFVTGTSGTHSTHVVTLQLSPDGVKWFDTDHVFTGVGNDHDAVCTGQEIRAKVTTAEGSASIIEIDLVSK